MTPLPLCRWRGPEITEDRYRCTSPKLLVSAAGVSSATCRQCYCANHPPPGKARVSIADLAKKRR